MPSDTFSELRSTYLVEEFYGWQIETQTLVRTGTGMRVVLGKSMLAFSFSFRQEEPVSPEKVEIIMALLSPERALLPQFCSRTGKAISCAFPVLSLLRGQWFMQAARGIFVHSYSFSVMGRLIQQVSWLLLDLWDTCGLPDKVSVAVFLRRIIVSFLY